MCSSVVDNDVMVSVFASSVVDNDWVQIKTIQLVFNATFRSNSKDWWSQIQKMCPSGATCLTTDSSVSVVALYK